MSIYVKRIRTNYNEVYDEMIKKLKNKSIDISQVKRTMKRKVNGRTKCYAVMKYNKPSIVISLAEAYFINTYLNKEAIKKGTHSYYS